MEEMSWSNHYPGGAETVPQPHRRTSGLAPCSPIALHILNYSHASSGAEAGGKVEVNLGI